MLAPATAAALVVGAAAGPAAAGTAVSVSVNAGQSVAVVPSTGIGINGSVYDSALTDAAVPGLLSSAGVNVVRFPGGSESDAYNWKTNTDVLSGKTQSVDFDQYASLLASSGAQGMVTVNYGSGDTIGASESPTETGAQLAADWVKYANVTHNYDIKYWEIGNEVYGNGTYGADWETDNHCASGSSPTNCGPSVYAANVKAYITAMKAVDPSISVGVVLTAPGNWPDGVTSGGSPQSWNQTVMTALAGQIGFADVHWYPQNPGNESDSSLLGDPSQIPSMVSTLRTELNEYAGQQNIPIDITETNSVSSNPGKQTVGIVNALYLEQDYLTWLSNGVSNVDWWQIHNGIVTGGNNSSSLYGTAAYGDYGVLSDASCATGTTTCEPAADAPFPAYYGLKLLGQFIHPGDTLVSASSSQSLVQAYAVKGTDGSLRVMLVNDDPSNSYTVNLGYSGFSPSSATPNVSTLAEPGSSITTGTSGSAASQTITPYSVTVVTLQPGSASSSPSASASASASASPSASASASHSASPSASASASASASPSASASASPSASASSSPTGTAGGCTLTWSLVNSWSGGFQLGFTVTNSGTSATKGWTVGFSWPGSQAITQIWNATETQTGAAVSAANLSYNGALQPGGSTTFGLLGSGSAPTSLSGVTCKAS
ncbi:cellulose binding domain-containing protein [Actinospica durhamensis]|uniref:Cellulose binding domain-containing protein n=1 Tax=Actinospica durhamensis TaxID=1508375 RepID=A0A941ER07_9ACTN|nr:cellulose binding domain-containing protein [Actinospica durhamensis]MBR7836372.1 cellulose binding domain-containing protein [Actinospica durhamensis]